MPAQFLLIWCYTRYRLIFSIIRLLLYYIIIDKRTHIMFCQLNSYQYGVIRGIVLFLALVSFAYGFTVVMIIIITITITIAITVY